MGAARRQLWAASVALALALGWTVPLTAETAPVEVEAPVFLGGFGLRFFEQQAHAFEAERPGVRVRLTGDPRVAERLRIRVLAGDTPTLTDAELPWAQLIRSGQVLNLSPTLAGPAWGTEATASAALPPTWRETFRPGALDLWTQDGATYGIPFGHAVICLFYNEALFARHGWQPPATWPEFFALAEKMKAAGVTPFVLPGQSPTAAFYLLRASAHRALGPEGYRQWQSLAPGAWADPRLTPALDALGRLARETLPPGWAGLSHTEAQRLFLRGEVGMLVTGSWLPNEMAALLPPDFALRAAPLPTVPDGPGDARAVQVGSGYYFIFAHAPAAERAAAVDFLRFLTRPASAATFAREVQALSAVRGVSPEAFAAPALRDVARLLDAAPGAYGWPPATNATVAAFRQHEVDALRGLLDGSLDAAAVQARLEATASRLRAQATAPAAIEVRHPWATAALAGGVVLALAWALWPRRGQAGGKGGLAPTASHPLPVRRRDLLLFLGPPLAVYTLFLAGPAVAALGFATLRWDGLGAPAFAGVEPLARVTLEGDALWAALRNNLILVAGPTLLTIPLSLGLAALLHRGVWGRDVFRATLLFPNLVGGVAAVLLWQQVYNPTGGLLGGALAAIGGGLSSLGLADLGATVTQWSQTAWLAPQTLIWAVVPIYVWLSAGFNMVLYLAAMEGIDRHLYEAAAIDGASPARQFWQITLPLSLDAVAVSAVFLALTGLGAFETVWVFTGQTPTSATHVLGTLLVSTLFRDLRLGEAAALGVVLLALVLAVAVVWLRLLRREAHD